MSRVVTVYVGSAGGETTDPNGFAFVGQKTGWVGSTDVGNWYCAALGGWLLSNHVSNYDTTTKYKTSGYYYANYANNTSSKGSISSVQRTYYTISTTSSTSGGSSGGTFTGGGEYVSGATCTLTATPSSGYVIKTAGWYSGTLPTKKGISQSLVVSADLTYAVEFQKVYNIVYDANGGDASSVPSDAADHYYNSGTSSDNVQISSIFPTRAGYSFLGWSKTKTGNVDYRPGQTYSNITSKNSITLYAVWTQYTLSYNTNGGSPTPASFSGAAGDTFRLPKASEVTKSGYVLSKWEIDGNEYSPNEMYTLTNEDLTANAVWRRPTVYITNSDTSKGTLKLYRGSVTSLNLIAEESNGVLMAEVADGNYIVLCTNKNILYEGSGLGTSGGVIEYASAKDGSGNATVSFSLVGSYEGRMLYAKRNTFSVGTNIVVFDKNNVPIVDNPPVCTAFVTSPSEPDDEGKYIVGRSITITGVPASGYEMKLVRVGGDEYSNLVDNKFTIPSLNSDVTANCYFTKIVYLLNAEIDAASSSAIRKVTVDDGAAQQATYGDTVVYEATLNDDTDAVFDGWYDGETLVSTANPYSHTVIGNTTLVAKAKVSVTLDIHYGDSVHQESCSLKVDNAAYVRGTPFDVTLGKSFSFELLLGMLEEGGSEPWKFDSWYYASDIDRENPIALGTSDIITPIANISLVADVTSEVLVKTLTVVLKNDETNEAIIATNAISIYPEADSTDYNPDTGAYTFSFNGSKSVRLTSIEAVMVGDSTLAFSRFDDAGVACENPDYSFMLTAQSKTITAFYGSTGVRTTTLMYGTTNGVTGNRTMGTFAITSTDDPDGAIAPDAQSAEVHRGKNIVIVATPNNGYKFGGWYTAQEIGGSAYLLGTTSTLRVMTNRTLYAWFIQDPNAIYEWEGGQSNKSFEWRSKTYTSNKPFNPSCCRVDAQGYPIVELDVDMFSAPNSAPTARAIVANIASQDARRLPPRRPERYLQVCVKNDKEVDSIIVGTNMTELAQ